jgi:hypothetical protein
MGRSSLRTGKTITVGFGLLVRNANGVGSRFRATASHMEDASSEHDSRPLSQNATRIHLPVLTRCLWGMLLASCIAWCQKTEAAEPSDAPIPTTYTDVRYGPHERNVLDVWQVPSTAPTPVLIYFHGGGFVGGDKAEAQRIPVVARSVWRKGSRWSAPIIGSSGKPRVISLP